MDSATFQMKATYDKAEQEIIIESTNVDDFPDPLRIVLKPGSPSSVKLYQFLVEQHVITDELNPDDFPLFNTTSDNDVTQSQDAENNSENNRTGDNSKVYAPAFNSGAFGVDSVTKAPVPLSLKSQEHILVTGSERYGKFNFARLLIDAANRKKMSIITIDVDDDLFGMDVPVYASFTTPTIHGDVQDSMEKLHLHEEIEESLMDAPGEVLLIINHTNQSKVDWLLELDDSFDERIYSLTLTERTPQPLRYGQPDTVVVFPYRNQSEFVDDKLVSSYCLNEPYVEAPKNIGEAVVFVPNSNATSEEYYRIQTYILPKA